MIFIITFIVSGLLYNSKIFAGEKPGKSGTIKSVVVLPFVNYTGTEQLEVLFSGMHACLISDISRVSGIRVINTTTSNVYKKAI